MEESKINVKCMCFEKRNDNSSRRKESAESLEVSRTKERRLCFQFCVYSALCLTLAMESSRQYPCQNIVQRRGYPMANNARICQLSTAGLASSNSQYSKLFVHYIVVYRYRYISKPVKANNIFTFLYPGALQRHCFLSSNE